MPICDNEMAGGLANGIDGDAHLANGTAQAGTWTSTTCYACTTCHLDTTYPSGTIHHVSANNYVADGNCTQCHTDPRPTPTPSAAWRVGGRSSNTTRK